MTEWICSKHWAKVPKAYRRAYARARKQYRKGQKDWIVCNRLW